MEILGGQYLNNMILLINICKEKLHYFEFVKPIEDILRKEEIKFITKNFKEINEAHLKEADKIIICGTSLRDNTFMEEFERFKWIRSYEKPLLGICGGMQLIGKIFHAKILQKTEIGFYHEKFEMDFLGISAGNEVEVYHLHNNFISLPEEFEEYTFSDIAQAIKHKQKKIYGVLFHPEVRNKEMIKEFLKI